MKIIVHIEDRRAPFFLELINSLNFVTIEPNPLELSESEQQFIEERLLHHAQNKGKSILWKDLKKQF